MPYRYNETTVEFEDIPEIDKSQHRPQSSRTTSSDSRQESSSDGDSGGSYTKILSFLLRLLFYALLGAIFSGIIG